MKKVLYLSLVASSIFSMELAQVTTQYLPEKIAHPVGHGVWKENIKRPSVFIPEKLGELELYHSNKGFSVYHNDKKHKIEKYFIDPQVRNATREELHNFLKQGYLIINRTTDGEFRLQANQRLVGGGPILGVIMYWATKVLCYGTVAAAAGTVAATGAVAVVAGTGAVAGASVAVGAHVVTGTIVATAGTTTVGAAIGTTAGVVVGTAAAGATVASGAGVVGAAIVGASASGAAVAGTSLASAAVVTTAAGVSTAGSVATAVVAIESLSTTVGTFFGMLPTP